MKKRVRLCLLLIIEFLILNQLRASEPTVALPVFIENEYINDCLAVINTNDDLERIDISNLLSDLEDWVEPKIYKEIKSKVTNENQHQWIQSNAINEAGLKLNYNPGTLEVKIYVPILIRRPKVVSLSGFRKEDTRGLTDQSQFSTFINFQAAQDIQNGRRPLKVDIENATQFKKFVFETKGRINEDPPYPWIRDDFRLIRDDQKNAIRYTLGDLNFSTSGFQRFIPMGGVSASTTFGIQPFKTITPSGNHEIILKHPSIIKIWMNGRLLQSLSLSAGRHNLRDFPFGTGLNDVVFEITDDVGNSEKITYTDAHSDLLLSSGLHELNYAIGAPSTQDGVNRKYKIEKSAASVSHRYGFNDHLTAGVFGQGSHEQATYGFNSYFSTVLGNFGAEVANSKIFTKKLDGLAYRLSYLISDFGAYKNSQRSLNLGYEYKSLNFSALGETSPNQTVAGDLFASYSQPIWNVFTATISGRQGYNHANVQKKAPRSLSVAASKNWGNGFDTLLTVAHIRDASNEKPVETVATFFMVISLGEKNQYINSRASTTDRTVSVEYGKNSSRKVGAASYSLGVERSDIAQKADARVDYIANRATLRLTHEMYKSIGTNYNNISNTTGIRIATALAYADGAFALSRPIRDGFIIYKPVQNLSDYEVHLNPDGEGNYESTSGGLGAGVLPEIPSYRPYSLLIEAPDLPMGVNLPRENYIIKNTYKAGTSIKAVNESTVFASGKLTVKGKPLSLATGELRLITDNAQEPVVFFTNRDGKFSVSSIKPGKYQVQIYDTNESGEFIIEEAYGEAIVGEVPLEHKK